MIRTYDVPATPLEGPAIGTPCHSNDPLRRLPRSAPILPLDTLFDAGPSPARTTVPGSALPPGSAVTITACGRVAPSHRTVRAADLNTRVTAHTTIGWYIAKYLSHTSIFLDGFAIKNIIVGNRSSRGYERPSDIGPAESAGGLRGDPGRVHSHE